MISLGLLRCVGGFTYCRRTKPWEHWHLYLFDLVTTEVINFPITSRKGLEMVRSWLLDRRPGCVPDDFNWVKFWDERPRS